jgi:hypothetical protein
MNGDTIAVQAGSEPRAGRAAAPSWVRPALGVGVALLAELAVVAMAAAKPSILSPPKTIHFSSWRAGPLEGLLAGIPIDRTELKIYFLIAMLVMAGGYALALSSAHRLPGRWVVASIVAAHAIVLLAPPLLLTDVYNYVSYAKLGVVHHLNPYVHPPRAARHDVIYPYATWHYQATPYGPLFTLATYPLARLGLPAGVWILKFVTVLSSLGCVGLLAACARRLGRPTAACALALGLNPLLIVYGVGGVHNDFLMMVVLLAGLLWLLQGRALAGGAAAIAAIGVKLAAAPMALFVLLSGRPRRLVAVAAVAAAALLLALFAIVFGTRAPGLTDQANTITNFSVPDDLAALLGLRATHRCAGHFYPCLNSTISLITTLAFAVAMLALAWRAFRGADPLACAGWAAVALILTLASVMPWYVLWVLPFAALSRSRALQVTTGVLCVLLLFFGQPTAHLISYGA